MAFGCNQVQAITGRTIAARGGAEPTSWRTPQHRPAVRRSRVPVDPEGPRLPVAAPCLHPRRDGRAISSLTFVRRAGPTAQAGLASRSIVERGPLHRRRPTRTSHGPQIAGQQQERCCGDADLRRGQAAWSCRHPPSTGPIRQALGQRAIRKIKRIARKKPHISAAFPNYRTQAPIKDDAPGPPRRRRSAAGPA